MKSINKGDDPASIRVFMKNGDLFKLIHNNGAMNLSVVMI